MPNLHYKLNPDHSVTLCSEEEAEAQFLNPETKRVGVADPAKLDMERWRYETWDEAWKGHRVACEQLAAGIKLGVILS